MYKESEFREECKAKNKTEKGKMKTKIPPQYRSDIDKTASEIVADIIVKTAHQHEKMDNMTGKEKAMMGGAIAGNIGLSTAGTALAAEKIFPKAIEMSETPGTKLNGIMQGLSKHVANPDTMASKVMAHTPEFMKKELNPKNIVKQVRTPKGRALFYGANAVESAIEGAGIGAGLIAKRRHDAAKMQNEVTASDLITDMLDKEAAMDYKLSRYITGKALKDAREGAKRADKEWRSVIDSGKPQKSKDAIEWNERVRKEKDWNDYAQSELNRVKKKTAIVQGGAIAIPSAAIGAGIIAKKRHDAKKAQNEVTASEVIDAIYKEAMQEV